MCIYIFNHSVDIVIISIPYMRSDIMVLTSFKDRDIVDASKNCACLWVNFKLLYTWIILPYRHDFPHISVLSV